MVCPAYFEELPMKLNDSFVIHTIGEETLLIPTGSAPFHGLGEGNKTVGTILRCLLNDTDEEKIIDALAKAYDGSREEMAEDVRSVIEKLRAIGAIEE